MTLNGKNIIARYRSGEGVTIVCLSDHNTGIIGHDMVAVHEIKEGLIGNAVPERMRLGLNDLIPTHMWHFKTQAVGTLQIRSKTLDLPRQNTQPGGITFFAVVKQHLQANADTEERFAGCRIDHCLAQLTDIKFGHAVTHSALPGKNYTVGRFNHIRRGGQNNLSLARNMTQRLRH